jgi:hypothetical protein
MRLGAITKARALAIIELDEMNLGGKVRFSDCIAPLIGKYRFDRYPQKQEDFDLGDKGVKFESGKAGDITIDSLVIYSGAIYVDTLASTERSQNVLIEMLQWARGELGLTYEDGMIRKWGYISDLIFFTDFPILASLSAPVRRLAEKTSSVTETLWGGLKYQSMSISIGHDPTLRKNGIASLFIQHRINSSFAENKYFSEAPLPTDLHIKFLEEFEADVLESISES